MPPFEFLKRPVRWLELIDRHWLDVSLAPNFAYQMCAAKTTDEQVARLDLSGWQVAGNGAEAVQAATLEAFTRRFAPAGFRAEAFTVGYGLAEAMAYTSVGSRDRARPPVCPVDAARSWPRRGSGPPASAEVLSRAQLWPALRGGDPHRRPADRHCGACRAGSARSGYVGVRSPRLLGRG